MLSVMVYYCQISVCTSPLRLAVAILKITPGQLKRSEKLQLTANKCDNIVFAMQIPKKGWGFNV